MGIKRYLNRIVHFRGHGIHSPFVYGMAREVFMPGAPGEEIGRLCAYCGCAGTCVFTAPDPDTLKQIAEAGGQAILLKGALDEAGRRLLVQGLAVDRGRYVYVNFDKGFSPQYFLL